MSTEAATAARLARAELKRQLKHGALPLADALVTPAARGMTVADIVAMLPYRRVARPTSRSPKPARHAAHRVCALGRVPAGMLVGELGAVGRESLVAAYAEYHSC